MLEEEDERRDRWVGSQSSRRGRQEQTKSIKERVESEKVRR